MDRSRGEEEEREEAKKMDRSRGEEEEREEAKKMDRSRGEEDEREEAKKMDRSRGEEEEREEAKKMDRSRGEEEEREEAKKMDRSRGEEDEREEAKKMDRSRGEEDEREEAKKMDRSRGEEEEREESSAEQRCKHLVEMQQVHKADLKKKFQCLMEGITKLDMPTALRKIYTDLHVTEGGAGWVSHEHEVRQIEREATEGRPIKCSDIFKPLLDDDWKKRPDAPLRQRDSDDEYDYKPQDAIPSSSDTEPPRSKSLWSKKWGTSFRKIRTIFKPAQGQPVSAAKQDAFPSTSEALSECRHKCPKPIRTALTKGVAGIGKTVSVQKFILDWAEGKANWDVHFIFPLPFRELNLMKEKKLSLVELVQHFYPEITDPSIFTSSEHRVMFIFDGLDECRLPLDFHSNRRCCDVTEPASVDVLLTNLIKGNLLPSALLWITTRPAAANQIPLMHVDQITEIRGFGDPQKEEYFRKKISNKNLASRTITHLKSSRSLYIMCHIPIFCWIAATVVERTSDESERVEMPRTLTQMYTHFLLIQICVKKDKYAERKETDEEMIFRLGKLALQQLEKGNLIFYEEDLRECGIDATEASVYSGLCTQIFREEAGLYQGKVFSFVHLSIQEFLAALYVFLCFCNRERNMPDQHQTSQLSALFRAATLHDLHKTAVDLALQSRNGHLDLFLRFLLGLSLETNQKLLRHLLPKTRSQSQSSEQTVQLVKEKVREKRRGKSQRMRMFDFDDDDDDDDDVDDVYNESRKINLFYCLNELNQHAVVEVIDRASGTLCVVMLLPGQWKTKTFKFKMSEDELDEFDLQKYIKTPEKDQTELLNPDEVLQKLLPVVTTSTFLETDNSMLTEKSYSCLASALTSQSTRLRYLSLRAFFGSRRYSRISVILESSAGCHADCKPTELMLEDDVLTEEISSCLLSALMTHSSQLRLQNEEEDNVELVCSPLSQQNCKLEMLHLFSCKLTEKSCSHLACALTSPSSPLRHLELSHTKMLDSVVELLSSALSNQNCQLEKLRLFCCELTEKRSCVLVSALTSPSSSLRRLELERSKPLDPLMELLCSALSHQNCKLEELRLADCQLTETSCSSLASALTSHSSRLRLLDLSKNGLQDSGVQFLCSALCHQNCKLEELWLGAYNLGQKNRSYLTSDLPSVLTSPSSRLRKLALSQIRDTDVEQLCALVKDSRCALEELDLGCYGTFRKESPAAAAAASAVTDKAQQDSEAAIINDPQSSCEFCAKVPATSHWVLLKPKVSTEQRVSTYILSSAAGCHECSESGLRWSCAGPVTLQYRFTDWQVFAEELAHMQARPAGPLMDIRLLSGELEEIHLPHFLCLGGCEASVRDAVRVLHGRDGGVCVEVCELSQRHARLLHPSFSLYGVIYYLKSMLYPWVHSNMLVYQSSPSSLTYRAYLLPEDDHLKQLVERDEEKVGGVWRTKPRPVRPLQMDQYYSLRTDCPSKIYPEELMLRYSSTTPNFFEVDSPEAAASFHMELFSSADSRGQYVWRAMFQLGENRDARQLPESQARTTGASAEGGNNSQTVAPSLSQCSVQGNMNITTHIHVQPSSAVDTDR